MQKIINALEEFDNIVFVGGGTGGHISPIISLHKELCKNFSHKKYLWIGGKNSEEEKEARKANIPFQGISVLKLSSTKSIKTAWYPFAILKSIFEAWHILKNLQKKYPKIAIFSKWWPGALAIGIAAKSLKIKIFIHESDTIPGRSNLKMAKFSEKIFLGFDTTRLFFKNTPCEVVGQILDASILEKNPNPMIAWKTWKPHILVFCGSQGAKSVFEEIIKNGHHIDAEWLIVLGKLNTNMREKFENFQNIHIIDWLEKSDQNSVFSGTNLAITRGSATTLAELELFGIKKIIIPLPSAAKNHQFFNAKEYEQQGDIVLEQKNIHQLHSLILENIQ